MIGPGGATTYARLVRYPAEPFRIKVVEMIRYVSRVLPRLDLVRLAIPRRVYTSGQIRYVGLSVIEVFRGRERLRGLRIVYEAPVLRHFTARLESVEPVVAR